MINPIGRRNQMESDAELIFKLIAEHKVDYFCGAPVVLSMLINTPEDQKTARFRYMAADNACRTGTGFHCRI